MPIMMPCLEGGARETLTERHVQALWYDREMRPGTMLCSDGSEVRVVDPGVWNTCAGPDFLGATIEVGRTRRRLHGDVEVHLRPGDWTAHGHAGDARYSNVIAHVTWLDGNRPETLPCQAISIALSGAFAAKSGFSPEQIDLAAYPFSRLGIDERPCHARLASEPDLGKSVLAAAGARRLATKAQKFRMLLMEDGKMRMQVFYEEFMNALGYSHNSRAFRTIAEMLPYEAIMRERDVAELAFAAAAGFVEWDMRSSRPNNAPAKRLSNASAMILAGGLKEFADAVDFSPRALRRLVRSLARGARMGRGRAAAIVTNVVIPMALAENRLAEPPAWMPPEDVSSVMKLVATRLFTRDHNPNALYLGNGLLLQGLLQIHRQYCLNLYPDCDRCAVAYPCLG